MKAKVLCSVCGVFAAVALEAAVDVSTIDPIVPLSIRCCDDLDGKWIPLGTTASAWKPGLKFEICQPEFFLVSDAVK